MINPDISNYRKTNNNNEKNLLLVDDVLHCFACSL